MLRDEVMVLYWGIYKKTKSGGVVVTGEPLYTNLLGKVLSHR
jgi:hypothetical protein